MSGLKVFFTGIAIFIVFCSGAQVIDIERLMEAKPFSISGSLSTDMIYSENNLKTDTHLSPFQYFVNGDITAIVYDQVSIPLSFSFTNRKFDARYPNNQQKLNRFGISPKYKWLTLHAGWSNMRFSKYSLNGHNFLGGGAEVKHGNYEVKLMHGRLLNEVIPYPSVPTSTGNRPVYERWGSGLQVEHSNQGDKYGLSLFRSSDRYASIPNGLDSIGITPEDNFVIALNVMRKINKFITVAVDYGNSQLTNDNRQTSGSERTFGQKIAFVKNRSTHHYHAIKADLGFQIKKVNIKVGYERIEPGYRSHGAYFYNNDLENFTCSFATPLAKSKLNVNTSIGLGRDNLDNTKASTSNRLLGQANVSWKATEKLNFNVNYSNFTNITEFNPFANLPQANPYDNIDSLRFVQVSRNTSFNTSYATATKALAHAVTVLFNLMQTTTTLGGDNDGSGGNFYNSNLAYNLTLIPQRITITLSCAYNQIATPAQNYATLGPAMGVSKQLFQKVNASLMYIKNTTMGDQQGQGNVDRLQLSASYTLKEKHNFSLSAAWMERDLPPNAALEAAGTVTNYLTRLRYLYSF